MFRIKSMEGVLMKNALLKLYNSLKKQVNRNLISTTLSDIISDIYFDNRKFLNGMEKIPLKSNVAEKKYFSFGKEKKLSRPINLNIYLEDEKTIVDFINAVKTNDYSKINAENITKACYTIAIGFCSVIDLLKTGDQKTPGTFFEYFIGHLFARKLNISPKKKLEVLNLGMRATLPTDFVFDPGSDKTKIHLPVKTSTRERVIQVWAHQRVLDGVYGVGRFRGILVGLSETKLDSKRHIVTEICLPDQWRLYQMFIAQLSRVYYLDPPKTYSQLNNAFPKITVLPFGNFFFEIEDLLD